MRVLVACGTHRFGADARAAFERDVLTGLPVSAAAWHEATAADLVDLGAFRGHPWLAEAGPLLAVGSVEPHYFAGFTGAHKTLTIGVASRADVEQNHAGAMSPEAQPARLEGNPVYDGIAEMVRAVTASRPTGVVNVVQAGADVLAAFGGEPLASLQAAARLAERCFVRRLDAPADVLILEETGPLARTFYQADKCLKNAEQAVRDGGTLILAASCADGIGQDHFVALLREAPTWADARRVVESRGYRLGDHKAVRLRALTDQAGRGVTVYAVGGGLSEEDCAVLGFIRAADVDEALSRTGRHGPADRVFRVEDAGNLVVRV